MIIFSNLELLVSQDYQRAACFVFFNHMYHIDYYNGESYLMSLSSFYFQRKLFEICQEQGFWITVGIYLQKLQTNLQSNQFVYFQEPLLHKTSLITLPYKAKLRDYNTQYRPVSAY